MTLRQRWLKALRSGEYTQAKCRLTDGESHCCLGVACDLDEDLCLDESMTGYLDSQGKYHGSYLPESTFKKLGFNHENGLMVEHGQLSQLFPERFGLNDIYPAYLSLSELNDTNGLTFSEIADVIEKFALPEKTDD